MSGVRVKVDQISFGQATWLVVAAGLIWRAARYLANWPLWGDEAYIAVNVLTRGFLGLTQPLEYYQIAPPGFLWSELVVVRLLGASELALRMLPFLCGVASLLLFWRFAKATTDRRATLMAVALFAASFYPIRHANEVKPYAGDLLLAQALTMLAWSLIKAPSRRLTWILLILTSMIGVWISYPLIFVSGGVGLWLAWRFRGNWRLLGASLAFLASAVISWGLMYWMIAQPQAAAAPFLTKMATWENSFPPLGRPLQLVGWLIATHTGNMMAYPYGGNNFGSVATTILVGFGLVALARRNRPLLLLLLAPVPPALAAAAVHRYPYGTSARIALFLAPAICLLGGIGISRLIAWLSIPRLRRSNYIVIAAGFAFAALAGAVFSVFVPYKDIDDLELRQVIGDLAARTKPGDRWLGFNGLKTLPRDKEIMLMPWLQHTAQLRFYALRDTPVPLDWNPDEVAVDHTPWKNTWLIMHNSGFDKFSFSDLARLEARLARIGPRETTRIDIRPLESVEIQKYEAAR